MTGQFKRNRSMLAVICCAMIFGIVSTNYYYVALGGLLHLPLRLVLVAVFTLLLGSAILFLGLVSIPKSFSRPWLSFPYPLRVAAISLSFLWLSLLALNMAFANLGTDIQKMFYLLRDIGIVSLVALLAVSFAPTSRLEDFLTLKFSQATQAHWLYRLAACLLLTAAVLCVAYVFYQFRQFESQSAGG